MTGAGYETERRDRSAIRNGARVLAGLATLVLLTALAVTGLWLRFAPEPDATLAWEDIQALERQIANRPLIHNLHEDLAVLTVITGVIWAVAALAPHHRLVSRVAPPLLLAFVALAWITTPLGPADGDDRNAITTGTNISGFEPVQNGEQSWADPGGDARLILHGGSGLVAILVGIGGLLALRPVARQTKHSTATERQGPS